jgi:hypothetical protein
LTGSERAALEARLRRLEVLDKTSGSSLLAVQAALSLQRFKADLNQYKIRVVRDNELIVVIFTDKNLKPGTRGYTPGRPGFEVALEPPTLRVIRANFIR